MDALLAGTKIDPASLVIACRHMAGPFDVMLLRQVCTRCGLVLIDYAYNGTLEAEPRGWDEGPVYVYGPHASAQWRHRVFECLPRDGTHREMLEDLLACEA